MLLGKPIAIAAVVGSLTLLIQFSPLVNLSLDLPSKSVDGNQHNSYAKVNYLSGMPEYFSWLWLSKHHRINQVELPMKIKFRQSGGYAGLRMGCELDTNLLPSEEATKLQSLVEQSQIFQTKSDRSKNTADPIDYEITIETKEGTHQVTFDDLTMPKNTIPLLDYLQDRAKPLR